MKLKIFIITLLFASFSLSAQIKVTAHQEGWSNIPPEAQKRGYSFQRSVLAQIDDDPQLEEVILFGHDNGHWPEFDLFKFYVAVVGNYDKQVKYISDEFVTETYNLLVEDRNNDGRNEIYIKYIKDGSFSVDERGYYMQAQWCYDRIEMVKEQ